MSSTGSGSARLHVGFFVTCLVDLFRPTVGFASIKLLEDAGVQISVPRTQTCCGQPAYNSGDRASAIRIAKQTVKAFEEFDFVVAPSGSCAAMISVHYPTLLGGDPDWGPRARRVAAKTFELTAFLVDVLGQKEIDSDFGGDVTYHDSCSGLRELNIKDQPRKLLGSIPGVSLKDLPDSDACCGFGGTFCVKYPDISNAIVDKKTKNIVETGATTLLAGDLGCLMNMAGKLNRMGAPIQVRHVAEVLADMAEGPAIAESQSEDDASGGAR